MKRINLKDYYHHVTTDTYIDIPEDVFYVFEEYRKAEQAYQSKIYYHNAYYSLDCRDDIEVKAIYDIPSPEDICIHNLTTQQIYTELSSLPDKQAKRIYAHYFLGMSKVAIAKAEGVSPSSVKESIFRGLKHIKKNLKNIF